MEQYRREPTVVDELPEGWEILHNAETLFSECKFAAMHGAVLQNFVQMNRHQAECTLTFELNSNSQIATLQLDEVYFVEWHQTEAAGILQNLLFLQERGKDEFMKVEDFDFCYEIVQEYREAMTANKLVL